MGADLFASANLDVNTRWCGLADHLRRRLGAQQFAVWFGTATAASVAPGRLALALPNEFTRRWVASHFDDELRRWAESTGVSAVELVVDPSLGEGRPLAPDVLAPARRPEPAFPPGLTTRLLAERGFWSLEPRRRSRAFVVEDLRGTLSVEPTGLGAPAVYEAVVF